jgi:hypothetical protein
MSITWGNINFEGPYSLTNWDPPYRAAVYAIMMKPDPQNDPATYRILYFGESENLSDRGFYRSHHKYDCWIKYAKSDSNLFIGIYPMPNSTKVERQEIESMLKQKHHPDCN